MATQLYGPPKVGGDVLSYCGKCKMELAHVIIAMIDTRPAKVQCKTCRSPHNYRPGEPAHKTSAPKKQRVPKTYVKASEYWEKKMGEKNSDDLRPYSIKDKYVLGDVIQHPKFGMGIVELVQTNGKITVLFRDGEKILVHLMGSTGAS